MPIKNYGTEQRSKPRLIVLRGWDPNNPTAHRNISAPVANGVVIKSGQLIGLRWQNGQQEFDLGLQVATDMAYFAIQDYDDFDVVASGVLTGLCSADSNTIQTPYYTVNGGLVLKAAVFADAGTPGNVALAAGNAAGSLCGYVARFNGPVDIKSINSEALPDGNGQVLVLTIDTTHHPLGDVTP